MWRVYYDDGTTGDSTNFSPEIVPALGVLCVVQPDPDTGRHRLSKVDYYWFENEEWWGGDLFGLFDYLTRPGLKVVKFGRTVDNETFRRIMAIADADPDFPARSGWKAGER